MNVFRITGGRRIFGRARLDSAKNAVLPILAASMLTEQPVTIEGFPELSDTRNMLKILTTLGCKYELTGDVVTIDAGIASKWEMPDALSKAIRSSIFMLGPIIGRFRKAVVTYPGGCEIGLRPIDLHIKGLKALGAKIREQHGMIYCDGSNLRGATVHLDFPSVGATENLMMAAATAPGTTVIHNPAREPEIVDLARFMSAMGAKIRGAGSGSITIEGVKRLNGTRFRPMPDRIVAGTLLTAAAMTGGEIELENAVLSDMGAVVDKLQRAGCAFGCSDGIMSMRAPEKLKAIEVSTQPFPGFPTDMQAQFMAMSCVADGVGVIVENVFENRFSHACELRRMGADIIINDRIAVIRGGVLTGARIAARDLRAGAALVLAGLAADGVTEVEGANIIDRGYVKLEKILSDLGAAVERI
ncbi:MAG: UDP-N-acetylglucosamine 1-carboxyvinyltransferase [Clostridia bacterium]|nr:UDP-N-acetylglucosamine 1-carboxyvinyltransferase [Clostridia bacterium]